MQTNKFWNAVGGRRGCALKGQLWNNDEWGKYKIYVLIADYNKLTPKAKTLELLKLSKSTFLSAG